MTERVDRKVRRRYVKDGMTSNVRAAYQAFRREEELRREADEKRRDRFYDERERPGDG